MVLLDFYAEWCGPCKSLSKELENFNLVEIKKINVDEDEEELCGKYYIRSIPTLILLDDNNNVLLKRVGFCKKEELESEIKKFL